MRSETIKAGSRTGGISRADKVLSPGDGITKMDLAGYYGRIGDLMPGTPAACITPHVWLSRGGRLCATARFL